MTISITSNALAIGQSVSSKYNGLLFDYGAFTGRTASQDKNNHSLARLFNLLSTVKKYACGGNLRTGNHKRQLVRSKVRTKVRTKNAIIKRLFIKVRGKVRTENSPFNCELNDNKIETRISQPNKNNGTITVIKNRGRSANYLADRLIFSRQALMTQAEKLLFSFCDNSSICFINSWGNLISLRFVNFVSLAIMGIIIFILKVRTVYNKKNNKKSIDPCGHNIIYCADRLILKPKLNDSPMYWHTRSYLTKPLNGVMIMANRYHNAHPCAKQFKFINIVTSQAIQIIATTYNEAKKQVNNDYVLTVRKPLNQGGF